MHIPKTGGTSVEHLFKGNGFDLSFHQTKKKDPQLAPLMRCTLQHLHWAMLRELLRVDQFDYIFAMVRHPVERFISEYRMRPRNAEIDFNAWAMQALDKLEADAYASNNHLRRQVDFLSEAVDVHRLEDGLGAVWLAKIEARLGMPLSLTPPKGASRSTLPRSAIQPSAAVLARLHAVYRDDFERLGYRAEPVTAQAA